MSGAFFRAVSAQGAQLAFGCVLAAASSVALALDTERSVFELHHTAWGAEDGAPTGVAALAQTADGYLWVGTSTGLFRFDGLRFERFESIAGASLPSPNIYSLWAPPTGGLWIGYRLGGASFFEDGHLTDYSVASGMPAASTNAFATDADGGVWIATARGLLRRMGSEWQPVEIPGAAAGAYIRRLTLDRDGALWAVTDSAVVVRRPGAVAFEETGVHAIYGAIAEGGDGAVWLTDDRRGVRKLRSAGEHAFEPEAWLAGPDTRGILIDRDGGMWLTTRTGVVRIRFTGGVDARPLEAPEQFDETHGLSGDYVSSVLEDREGNIWIGTTAGLDRFREAALVKLATPPRAQYFSLAAGPSGSMWVGINTLGLFTARDDEVEQAPQRLRRILGAYRAADSSVWFGADASLWHLRENSWERVSFPTYIPSPPPDVQAMVQDREGALWVSLALAGVHRLADGVWTPFGGLPMLPRDTPLAAAVDSDGRVWLGYTDNRAAVVDGADVRVLGAEHGLAVGHVLSLDAHGQHVWIGGETGLARLDGERFQTIVAAGGRRFGSVSGIVETADGDLWLNDASGVTHIAAGEIDKSLVDSSYALDVETFDSLDGLPGTLQGVRPLPSAVQGTDGRMWFATSDGVVWIDPGTIRRNTLAPPVLIQSVDFDGALTEARSGMQLPMKTRNLRINYTALSFTIPERVRFRYQLEGVDNGWQDPGERRQAFYTNLAPRDYRFRVIAANNDGVWNEQGATLEFTIPPTFFETGWFVAICAAGGAILLWLLYLLRLHQVSTRIRERLETRMNERERIARDLHDTLLQSTQGLIYRFQAEIERLPRDEPTRVRMEEALDRADSVLAESRDHLSGLRGAAFASLELGEALKEVGEQLAKDRKTSFAVIVKGQPRGLHPVVREEAQRIGSEALVNAFQHANASYIELEIVYDVAALDIRVRDDGIGMAIGTFDSRQKPGHWGLRGMRERATQIHATFDVWSRAGAGTEVALRVPATFAYQTESAKMARRPRILRFLHRGGAPT